MSLEIKNVRRKINKQFTIKILKMHNDKQVLKNTMETKFK